MFTVIIIFGFISTILICPFHHPVAILCVCVCLLLNRILLLFPDLEIRFLYFEYSWRTMSVSAAQLVIWQVYTLCYVHKCNYPLSRHIAITVSLTVFLMQWLLFPWLMHSITGSLVSPSLHHPLCPTPYLLPSGNCQFVLRIYRTDSFYSL